jgi:hypothetical protein
MVDLLRKVFLGLQVGSRLVEQVMALRSRKDHLEALNG